MSPKLKAALIPVSGSAVAWVDRPTGKGSNIVPGFFIRLSMMLKIGAGVIGIIAASAWLYSAYGPPDMSNQWNGYAATFTAIAVFFQASTAFIDAKYPPLASWG